MKQWERDGLSMMTMEQIKEVCILEEYNRERVERMKAEAEQDRKDKISIWSGYISPLNWFPGESERMTHMLLNILVQRNMILKHAGGN